MALLNTTAEQLQKDFPAYRFYILQGLWEKYIAVENHGKIVFTIWIDKNSGYKELLDEVDLSRKDWFSIRFRTRLFHWSKYRKGWRRDYPRLILEKMELNLAERKLTRQRLEQSLEHIHIE